MSDELKFKNQGLRTIFFDKLIKVMHIALLHPQEYSVDTISHFLFERTYNSNHQEQRNWHYLQRMFDLVGNSQSVYYSDVKLSFSRFVAEFLLRLPMELTNHLDELLPDSSEDTYGTNLLLEMGSVFKVLYENQGEDENAREDICTCLSILLARSLSAKRQAVESNLIKKVTEIGQENAGALHLSELQKAVGPTKATKGKTTMGATLHQSTIASSMFESQFKRKYKYA